MPGLSECHATPADPTTFIYPGDEHARGRIIKPGTAARLRVLLNPFDQDLADFLGKSELLTVLQGPGAEEVLVEGTDENGWTISDKTTREVASVPPKARAALRAGLNYYAGYRRVLNMANAINELSTDRPLQVRLLDCTNGELVQQNRDTPSKLPPIAPSGEDQYRLKGETDTEPGDRFAIEITNHLKDTGTTSHNLDTTVFLCSAFGRVVRLAGTTVGAGATEVLWSKDTIGKPFGAGPSSRRGDKSIVPPGEGDRPETTVDRLVIIATNQQNVDLSGLRQDKRVQEVVDEIVQSKGSRESLEDQGRADQPEEIWVAKIITITQGKV
jgi:hypothetical protein